LQENSFDEAFSNGCSVVIHTAAVVKSNYDTDPFSEIITPALQGSIEVARTAAKYFSSSAGGGGGLKRIVQTSSVSAIHQPECDRHPLKQFKPFDESEWRLDLRPHRCAYEAAKVLSERAVNDTFPGEVVSILPSFTLGPMLSADVRSTLAAVKLFANREMPLAPANRTSFVDVRDVAFAHVRAALADSDTLFRTNSSSSSSRVTRFICSQKENRPLLDIGVAINKLFAETKSFSNCPVTPAPWFVLWTMSFFDRRISSVMLEERCVERPAYDNTKILTQLDGFEFRFSDFDAMIKDCVDSMVKFGVLTKS
jgi:nucleoside-diphosphate-sugar epimerase